MLKIIDQFIYIKLEYEITPTQQYVLIWYNVKCYLVIELFLMCTIIMGNMGKSFV